MQTILTLIKKLTTKPVIISGVVIVIVAILIVTGMNHLLQSDPNFFGRLFDRDTPDLMQGNTKYGNTPGNIANGGQFVASNSIIYMGDQLFSDQITSFEGPLYSITEADGYIGDKNIKYASLVNEKAFSNVSKTHVHNIEMPCLNIVNDYLYYQSDNYRGGKLNRVSLDGINISIYETDLTCGNYTHIVNDWMYYINFDDEIVKRKIGDTKEFTIANSVVNNITIGGGWIFYNTRSSLYKIRTDGSEKTEILKTRYGSYMDIIIYHEGYVYYKDYAVDRARDFDGYALRRINASNGDASTIIEWERNDPRVGTYNVSGGYVYYVQSDNIYRIAVDGQNNEAIFNDGEYKGELLGGLISVIGDWIYYYDIEDPSGFGRTDNYLAKRVKVDGSVKEIIVS